MGVNLMWVLGVVLVAAFVVLVVMVAVSTRSNTRLARPEPEPDPDRDPWEEALLASTPDAPTARPAPPVLDRDALTDERRDFDPAGWDDRPDGYEGTDFGMVGNDD